MIMTDNMSERRTNATEYTRLLQKSSKSKQKKINLTKRTYSYTNIKDHDPGDSAPSSSSSLSSSSPLSKSSRTKAKEAKLLDKCCKNSKEHKPPRFTQYFVSKRFVNSDQKYCNCSNNTTNPLESSSSRSSSPRNSKVDYCDCPSDTINDTGSPSDTSYRGSVTYFQKVVCSDPYFAPKANSIFPVKNVKHKSKRELESEKAIADFIRNTAENLRKLDQSKISVKHSKTSSEIGPKTKNKIDAVNECGDAFPESPLSENSTEVCCSSTFTVSDSATDTDTEDLTYDPHLHRKVENQINNTETMMHFIKCSVGTGILAMPQAFANSGFIPGIIFTIIIGVIINHCLRVLLRVQYALCKQRQVPLLTYAETVVAALEKGPVTFRRFSKPSFLIVKFFLVVLHLGICSVYIVFIAGNIKRVVDPYWCIGIESHMLFMFGPLILLNLIPNLKALAPYSALANGFTITSLGVITYCLSTDTRKSPEPIDLWGSIYTFPLFFGTTLYGLTAISCITPLERHMLTPKDFLKSSGVLNVGSAIVITLYVLIGTVGYLYCKSMCCGSIILNLGGNGPIEAIVLIMYAIGLLVSYALQCLLLIDMVWRTFIQHRLTDSPPAKQKFWQYTLRLSLCLASFIVALEFRRLGLFISMLGIAILGVMLPAFLEICMTVSYNFSTAKYINIIKDILLISIGLFALVVFCTAAVLEIISRYMAVIRTNKHEQASLPVFCNRSHS